LTVAAVVSSSSLRLQLGGGRWWKVDPDDPRALAVVDDGGPGAGLGPHYSRQTPGSAQFTPSGRKLILLTDCERAVWAVVENLDPAGGIHWRCSIFRNEGGGRSSDLIREATARTYDFWRSHYGGLPSVPLRTEVDAAKVRPKRDPGRCFLRAGWRNVGTTKGGHGRAKLVVLEAPPC
jgi:hypothetical protein